MKLYRVQAIFNFMTWNIQKPRARTKKKISRLTLLRGSAGSILSVVRSYHYFFFSDLELFIATNRRTMRRR